MCSELALASALHNLEVNSHGKGLPPPILIVIAITVIAIVAAFPVTFLLLAAPWAAAGFDPRLHIVAQRLILVTWETGPALRIQPYVPT